MSQYLGTLTAGAALELSGPWGTHEYLGRGRFRSAGVVRSCTRLGMMAGGTGLTPMLQVVTWLGLGLANPNPNPNPTTARPGTRAAHRQPARTQRAVRGRGARRSTARSRAAA